MSTLISPGVSVTITDESFYIPVSAPTVPLFFVATHENKFQPNGVTTAAGTNEHSVVRTVTSLAQSVQLYGIPHFRTDVAGKAQHGDARNEYGLFALNQFLGVGSKAFVVRANIDLRDAPYTQLTANTPVFTSVGSPAANGGFTKKITSINMVGGTAGTGYTTPPMVTFTGGNGTGATAQAGIVGDGVASVAVLTGGHGYTSTPTVGFVGGGGAGAAVGSVTLAEDIVVDVLGVAEVWTITFSSPTTYNVFGTVSGPAGSGTVGQLFDNDNINFTIYAGTTPFTVGDEYEITVTSTSVGEPLGANDAAKRVAIVTALAAEINSNTEVRSDMYEYNLILAPGYHEVVDELLALSTSVQDEAFVIADTPFNLSPDDVATWSQTSARQFNHNAAYYYPHGLASNLNGVDVLCAASGIALRTYAYSDQVSELWFAPAGARRGVVTGVSKVGYVSGTLGTATTFVESNLNQGQRDNLYEYYKNINPIVFFPGRGMIIWGQKTSANAASALDRVNVMRLLMYVKRQLRKGAFPFVFEPNDQLTRDNLKAAADGFLGDILIKRGLYDFVTLSDDSNNTPTRIDRNELWMDVAVKPVKAAEFIYIPIRVLSTGA